MPLPRAAATYEILVESSCTTTHWAHRQEATGMERQNAQQSRQANHSHLGTLLDADLPHHGVPTGGLGQKEDWQNKKILPLERRWEWKQGTLSSKLPNDIMPKELGGMGFPDLERFGRALRLRWLWQEWVDESKPWVGTEVPYNDTDCLLFNSSTTITLGNGNKACFWHHNWQRRWSAQIFRTTLIQASTKKEQDSESRATKC